MNNGLLKKLIDGFDISGINFDYDYVKQFESILGPDDFLKITPYNGFDSSNPDNGRQNNYAWAFCEFNGYIYVGTGRNLPMAAMSMILPGIAPPMDFTPNSIDMGAEIWRYKKDGSLPWEKVYKSPKSEDDTMSIVGIRSLIKFDSFDLKPAMYAGAYSMSGVKILKSTNGIDWFELKSDITEGTSSRTMMVYNNKLYMAAMSDGADLPSLLYSSSDPELEGWTLETPEGEEGKNPIGVIWAIKAFNNKIYLGTESEEGFMLWRTNGSTPKKDDWTLVIDKGAGDSANACAMSLEIFDDYLYVGTAANTTSPLSYVIPKGAEIIRVDKQDNWQIVMGGPPLNPTTPSKGRRNHPLSNYGSGFNNPYNLYMWQIKAFNNKLYVGTYDPSVSVEPTLEFFIKNKDILSQYMSEKSLDLGIELLKLQVKILSMIQPLLGSDFYVSEDGINFKPLNVNGFGNKYNYGVRNIFISDDNTMYLGTANPFQGCEVYKYLDPDNDKNDKDCNCKKDHKCDKYDKDDCCKKDHKCGKYDKDDCCKKDHKCGKYDKDDDFYQEDKYSKYDKYDEDDDFYQEDKYGKCDKYDEDDDFYQEDKYDKCDKCDKCEKCDKCKKPHKPHRPHKDDEHKKNNCKDDEKNTFLG